VIISRRPSPLTSKNTPSDMNGSYNKLFSYLNETIKRQKKEKTHPYDRTTLLSGL
jgi:hypothetical protein